MCPDAEKRKSQDELYAAFSLTVDLLFILNIVAAILIKSWLLTLFGLILNFSAVTFQTFKHRWKRFGNRVYSATCWSFGNTAALRNSLQELQASARGLWKCYAVRERNSPGLGGGGNNTGSGFRKPEAEGTLAVGVQESQFYQHGSPLSLDGSIQHLNFLLPSCWDLPYILQMGKCFLNCKALYKQIYWSELAVE